MMTGEKVPPLSDGTAYAADRSLSIAGMTEGGCMIGKSEVVMFYRKHYHR